MKASGKMDSNMESENNNSQMDQFILDNGLKVKKMDMDVLELLKNTVSREVSWMVLKMAKEFKNLKMEILTKEIITMENFMA